MHVNFDITKLITDNNKNHKKLKVTQKKKHKLPTSNEQNRKKKKLW